MCRSFTTPVSKQDHQKHHADDAGGKCHREKGRHALSYQTDPKDQGKFAHNIHGMILSLLIKISVGTAKIQAGRTPS